MFGSKPIWTKIPAKAISCIESLVRSLYFSPVNLVPSPYTSVVWAFKITSTLLKLRSFFCKTASALISEANSSTVTCSTKPAKSMAASTPELPPPITATLLPLNRGPSQCGQYVTPRVRYSFSPGTFIFLQRAPVAIIKLRVFKIAPDAVSIWCRSPSASPGIKRLTVWLSMTST